MWTKYQMVTKVTLQLIPIRPSPFYHQTAIWGAEV